jgi:uncharacterized phiE125 gp8 family phage protein
MTAVYPAGSTVTPSITTRDANGNPANVGSTPVCTITLPDGTTATPAVTSGGTGIYRAAYVTTMAGHHGVVWNAAGLIFEDAFNVDSTALFAPVSLTDVRSHLNITGEDVERDQELTAFIQAATSAIEQRVGPLTRRSVTESHNGGRHAIVLRHSPVITVTSATENGAAVPSGGYTISPASGVLTRTSGYSRATWVDGFNNVTVAYVAGRTSIPADLRQAVLELVRHLWSTQRGSMAGRRTGEEFVSGQGYTLPNRVLELIGPYEMPGMA